MLKVLLAKLIGNALRYSANEDKPEIEIGARQQDGTTVYFVRDNGTGFDMAHADRYFGAFSQRHAKAEFPSAGIGLSAAKRIVERHGGRIWTEAAIGAGATFYFTLGFVPAASDPAAVTDS